MYRIPTDGRHEILVETRSSLSDLRAAVERVIERLSGAQLLAVESERPIRVLVGGKRKLSTGAFRRGSTIQPRPRSGAADRRRMRVLYEGDTPASTVVALLMQEPEVASAEPRPFAIPATLPATT